PPKRFPQRKPRWLRYRPVASPRSSISRRQIGARDGGVDSSASSARGESKTGHQQLGVVMVSARNQFKGKIKSVKLGNVMAEVVIDVGPLELVSVITRESAEKMGLKTGKSVTAIVKSTEVLVATKD